MPEPLPPLSSTFRGALGQPFWNEGRIGLELTQLMRTRVPLGPGDGRRIIIVTGFLAGASTAHLLSRWLHSAGYVVDIAPTGLNMLSSGETVDRVTATLRSEMVARRSSLITAVAGSKAVSLRTG